MLQGKTVSIKAFLWRRVTRLEPPYILSLLIYTVAAAVHRHGSHGLLRPLLAHILYIHNFTHLQTLSLVT